MQNDYDLDSFALTTEDTDLKMPLLNLFKKINPDIELIGSLFSAPSWLKNSGLEFEGKIVETQKYYQTLANYSAL